MKKILYIAFLIAFLLVAAGAVAATKIDPMFNYIDMTTSNPSLKGLAAKFASVKTVADEVLVGAIVKATDVDVVAAFIEDHGGSVKTILNTVLTAEIPLQMIGEIAALEEVVYVEAAKMMTHKMNFARTAAISNVAPVQDGTGTGLSQAYTGVGSIVGVYDSGIDCGSTDFDNAAGQKRIINYKQMSTNKDYTAAEIAAGDCTDSGYHGTHVTGIAASSNATYKGVAPGASIVGVRMSSGSSTEVLEGISYIFTKAQNNLAPAVANISLGTSLGPHDGTSAFEAGIDELLSGQQGRSIVCAAGNETVNTNDSETGYTLGGLHAAVNVSGTDIGYETIIRKASTRSMTLDIWLAGGGDCKIEFIAYDRTSRAAAVLTTGQVSPAGDVEQTTGNLTLAVDFTDNVNALNNKQHAQAVVTIGSTGAYTSTGLTYDLIFRDNGSGCSGDVWVYLDLVANNVFTSNRDGAAGPTADYTYSKGDNNKMITIPATADNCIAVASFGARDTYVDSDGTTESQNVYTTASGSVGGTGTQATDISLFSSIGPGAGTGNLQKPTIAAPGEPIISTLSSNTTVTNNKILGDANHLKMEGTSMASPFVAGVVALIFQKNGCLSAAEIKTALTSTASTDANTGSSLPDYTWGYGKVDALAAINSVAESDCEPDNSSSSTTSNKNCSLDKGGRPAKLVDLLCIAILSALLFSAWFIFRKRARR